jgi:hypothetical protein
MTLRTERVVTAEHADDRAAERRDFVSWRRVLWVGPLTVVIALLVNLGIAAILRALNPAYAEMGQLGRSNMILTIEGAILAVIVFALMVWLVPHPIRWYRLVGIVALLLSLIPDLLLGLGGDLRRTGSGMVAPFSRFGAQFFPVSSGGGRPAGGGPSPTDVLPGMPWDQVLVLMVLHVATAIVCIVLLTTLTREPSRSRPRDPRTSGSRPLT